MFTGSVDCHATRSVCVTFAGNAATSNGGRPFTDRFLSDRNQRNRNASQIGCPTL